MTKQASIPNRMVVSNMAWDPVYDDHAIFLLQRYGISKVEILPTKYGSWSEVTRNPGIISKKYFDAGIHIYSFQSIFYGIDGTFTDTPDIMKNHLQKVVDLCKMVGVDVVVMGSPSTRKRKSWDSAYSEMKVSECLGYIQSRNPLVKICLEPNSSSYGCEIGLNIKSCMRMAKAGGFYINFDTGNYNMENDNCIDWDVCKVGHCQLSSSFLRPIHKNEYCEMMDPNGSGVAQCLQSIIESGKNISLECKVTHIKDLGKHIREFSIFMSKIK